MSPQRWQRVQELFEQAVELAPQQCARFLSEFCRGDDELRAEVAALLEHHANLPTNFMRPPNTGGQVQWAAPAAADALLGQRVGRYQIESVIAAGGMGTVYEAIQDEPHRVVALKVVNRSLLSASSVRRFQFEAQVLGRLRHPNIAQIYEAGMHGDGRSAVPFFAMEYIPGAKAITEFADDKKLAIAARLRLFIRICEAVDHGHQKGIIHRDLKPANMLVDSSGVPKVIDFGVARATGSDLALTTHQTDVGQLIGTMQYMSPEQCDADPHDLDVRSDVYSLGVVLYELLTGELPYEIAGSATWQVTRIIKEQTARRPSRVNPRLRGDAETIILTALEKERSRRYRSAAALADDIRRFLQGRPIAARPPSVIYLTTKFVRRHPWQMVATGLAGLLLLSGLIGFTVNARLGKTAAVRERVAAEQKQQLAQRISALRGAETALLAYDVGTARRLLEKAEQSGTSWELRHLKSRLDQSAAIVAQLPRPIQHISVDPRARFIAVCQNGAPHVEIRNFDGRVLTRIDLQGHEPLTSAINADGSLLAVATAAQPNEPGGYIWLFELGSSGAALQRRWIAHPSSNPSHLVFRPTEPLLASAADTGEVRLWTLDRPRAGQNRDDGADRLPMATLIWHRDAAYSAQSVIPSSITALAFGPLGHLLAAAGKDGTICLWDVDAIPTPREPPRLVLCGHSFTVDCLAFSPDERRLASGGVDGTIRIWDTFNPFTRTWQPDEYAHGDQVQLDVLYGHDAPVRALAFDDTGLRLISGGDDRALRLWETNETATVPDPGNERRELRVPRRRQLAALRGHEGPIVDLACVADGRIVSASLDGAVRLWWPEGEDIPRLRGHYTSVRAVAFTPDSGNVISADGDDGIIVWDADLCVPVARRHVRLREGLSDLTCWKAGAGSRTLLAVATGLPGTRSKKDGRVILWNISDPRDPQCISDVRGVSPGSGGAVCALAISADKRRLAAGDDSGTVRIWSVSENGLGERSGQDIRLADQPVCALAFLSNEVQSSALHSEERARPGSASHSFPARPASGDFILAACGKSEDEVPQQGLLCVWDTADNRLVWSSAQVPGGGYVSALAIHSDGTRIATGSYDSRTGAFPVYVWSIDWSSGSPTLKREQLLAGHTDWVLSLAFHPTEPRLASGSRDQTIRIWDLATQVEVATLFGHKGSVRDLAFDPKGERLASASAGSLGSDNVVWLWEAVTGQHVHQYARDRAVCLRAYREVQQAVRINLPSLIDAERRIAGLRSDSPWLELVQEAASRHFDDFVSRPQWLNDGAWDVVSRHYMKAEEYERARQWAQRACTISPWDGQVLNTLGIALCRCGRYEEAVEALKQAGELNNWHPVDHAFLAVAYYHLGDKTAAEQELARARQRCTEQGVTDVPGQDQLMRETERLIEENSSGS